MDHVRQQLVSNDQPTLPVVEPTLPVVQSDIEIIQSAEKIIPSYILHIPLQFWLAHDNFLESFIWTHHRD